MGRMGYHQEVYIGVAFPYHLWHERNFPYFTGTTGHKSIARTGGREK
jgi:hypothetical protein